MVQPIPSRTIEDVKIPVMQLLNIFPQVKQIYCDNEPSLNSETIRSLLSNSFGVCIANAPHLHSISNGQVERFHSTLLEIARCMKIQKGISNTVDAILHATAEYNKSVHAVTNKRPVDVLHASTAKLRQEIKNRVQRAQVVQNNRVNRSRSNRVFSVGEPVLVKTNRRLGNKLTPLYVEETIEADLGTSVLINGRMVHKDNLR